MEENNQTGEIDFNLAAYNLDSIADNISKIWFNIKQANNQMGAITEGLHKMANEMRQVANRYEDDLK